MSAAERLDKNHRRKIAIVHDYLCGKGGTERVVQYICEEFPDADLYTLAYNSSKTFDFYRTKKIHTTWLNIFVRNTRLFRLSFPVATYVMEKLDFSQYDVVISSSATVAKYINAKTKLHICYCYMPTRAIWHKGEYFSTGLRSLIYKKVMDFLKKRDYQAAQRVNEFIAISHKTREYIQAYYNRNARVVYCPVDTEKYYISKEKKDFYLLVSRLEKWKKIEYAIEAFNENGKSLHIIGAGEEENRLAKMAKSNVVFLGEVDDEELAREYSEAKAVIFTPFLEYGLIPLEANASGTAVICYGFGGVLETMVPLDPIHSRTINPTAVFFNEQNKKHLNQAISTFEENLEKFDSKMLKQHAENWGIAKFKKQFRQEIENICSENGV